jgi:hydrogenase maturation factor HypF (carbamoyltransferase family)
MSKAATRNRPEKKSSEPKEFRMLLIPCSCGTSFAVSEDYDHKGMHLRSFIPCPNCGKRHDPRNRLLHLDYQDERFWTVGEC